MWADANLAGKAGGPGGWNGDSGGGSGKKNDKHAPKESGCSKDTLLGILGKDGTAWRMMAGKSTEVGQSPKLEGSSAK